MEMYSMCKRATVSRAREYESERTHVCVCKQVCRAAMCDALLSLSLYCRTLSGKHLARDAMKRSVNYTKFE